MDGIREREIYAKVAFVENPKTENRIAEGHGGNNNQFHQCTVKIRNAASNSKVFSVNQKNEKQDEREEGLAILESLGQMEQHGETGQKGHNLKCPSFSLIDVD